MLSKVVAAAAATAVLLGTHAAAAATAPLKPSTRGAYFGSYVPPKEWTEEGQKAAVRRFEQAIGRKLDIVNLYYWWEKPFPTWREYWHLNSGRIPMISWDGTYTSKILSGSQDAYIRERANAVSKLPGKVFLRFFWEMDGRKKANVVESPSNFVAAWRHVHDIFEREGATNVVWVWAPNAWAFQTGEAMRYYPGATYVDWVAGDGYNWGGYRWSSFGQNFRAMYAQFKDRKPMMVAETGSVERGGNKATWIRHAAIGMRDRYPQIRALVWFNSVDGAYDWRVSTSRRTLKAYRDVAHWGYFNPRR